MSYTNTEHTNQMLAYLRDQFPYADLSNVPTIVETLSRSNIHANYIVRYEGGVFSKPSVGVKSESVYVDAKSPSPSGPSPSPSPSSALSPSISSSTEKDTPEDPAEEVRKRGKLLEIVFNFKTEGPVTEVQPYKANLQSECNGLIVSLVPSFATEQTALEPQPTKPELTKSEPTAQQQTVQPAPKLKRSVWKVLFKPICTPMTRGLAYQDRAIVQTNISKYIIFKCIHEGTRVNFYYDDVIEQWVMASNKVPDLSGSMIGGHKFTDLFNECLEKSGISQEAFYKSMSKKQGYSFGFHNPKFHIAEDKYHLWYNYASIPDEKGSKQMEDTVGYVDRFTFGDFYLEDDSIGDAETTAPTADQDDAETTRERKRISTMPMYLGSSSAKMPAGLIKTSSAIDVFVPDQTVDEHSQQDEVAKAEFKGAESVYTMLRKLSGALVAYLKDRNQSLYHYILVSTDPSVPPVYRNILLRSSLIIQMYERYYRHFKQYDRQQIAHIITKNFLESNSQRVQTKAPYVDDVFIQLFPRFANEYSMLGQIYKGFKQYILKSTMPKFPDKKTEKLFLACAGKIKKEGSEILLERSQLNLALKEELWSSIITNPGNHEAYLMMLVGLLS